MCVNYLRFYAALKAQGYDRRALPYRGYFQPWTTWIALAFLTTVLGCYGYSTFLPGEFTISGFLSYYTMVFVGIATYSIWKIFKRTKIVNPHEADLVWDRPTIDHYEALFMTEQVGFWRGCLNMFKKRKEVTHID